MKHWIPWLLALVATAGISFAAPQLSGGGCSNCLLRTGDTATGTIASSVGSGSNGFALTTNGAFFDVGTGSLDNLSSNGTYISVGSGSGYLASAVPETLDPVYVNLPIIAATFGGTQLPARAFTVVAIRYMVRTAGSGGSTNANFRITDGTNICDCAFACNATQLAKRTTCTGSAGTGCAYAASAQLAYAFTSVGDCTTPPDIMGNLNIEGNWQ